MRFLTLLNISANLGHRSDKTTTANFYKWKTYFHNKHWKTWYSLFLCFMNISCCWSGGNCSKSPLSITNIPPKTLDIALSSKNTFQCSTTYYLTLTLHLTLDYQNIYIDDAFYGAPHLMVFYTQNSFLV